MQILKAAFPDYMILFSTLTIQYCQRQEMPKSKTLSWPSLTPFGIHRIYSLSICCRHFLTQFKITHHLRFTKAKPSKMFFISDSCPICFGYVVKKIPGPQYLRYISIFATKKYIYSILVLSKNKMMTLILYPPKYLNTTTVTIAKPKSSRKA